MAAGRRGFWVRASAPVAAHLTSREIIRRLARLPLRAEFPASLTRKLTF